MLSKRIAYLRKKSGLSQSQFAQLLNISASTVGMYEQGRRIPSLDLLVQMSHVFNASLDYLITGKEYSANPENNLSSDISDECPCATCYWKEYRIK